MSRPNAVAIFAAVLAAAVTGTAAAADRSVDERRPLKPEAAVSVSNVAGLIEVEVWDKNELHLTGTLGEKAEKVEISGNESSLSIEVKVPRQTRNVDDTDLKLKVPPGVRLDLDAVSADIRVTGVKGPVTAESVSGDVTLKVGSEKVVANSVSGDVTLEAPAGRAEVQTVSGDVRVQGPRGEVHGESVSGDLLIQARELRRLELETVSGDIEFDGTLAPDAWVGVETLSGRVTLRVPGLPDGELSMETFSGELKTAFPPAAGKAKSYEHVTGPGKARIELHSFSGDIELKKR